MTWGKTKLSEVVLRAERAQQGATAALAAVVEPVLDGVVASGGPGAPFLNRVCGVALEREPGPGVTERIAAFYSARGEAGAIEVCPSTHRDFLSALGRAGYVLQRFSNVHVHPLQGAPEGTPDPAGIEIRRARVERDDDVDAFVRVSGTVFLPEGMKLPPDAIAYGVRCARAPGQDSFLAFVDGELAGAAGCDTRDGVTTIYGAAVLPKYRGRGVQQALIRARLGAAREHGSELAFVFTVPGSSSERNVQRVGFVPAYSRAVLSLPHSRPG